MTYRPETDPCRVCGFSGPHRVLRSRTAPNRFDVICECCDALLECKPLDAKPDDLASLFPNHPPKDSNRS